MASCKECAFYGKECESESQQKAVGMEATYEPCEIFCPKQRLIDANRLKMRMIAFATAIKREYLSIEAIVDTINTEDTVDAAPVVHGEWIDGRPYVNSRWKVCSVCHCTGPDPQGGFEYCPNCGAKMDGGKANEM